MAKGTRKVFGIHSVKAVLQRRPGDIRALFVESSRKDKRVQQIADLAQQAGIRITGVDKETLNRQAEGINHQGIMAELAAGTALDEAGLKAQLSGLDHAPFVLILDGVTDPHNLGAILRTADAAGVDAVIAPKNNAVGITSTVSKIASGAAESVPYVQVTNLARTIEWLKQDVGIWLVGTSDDAGQTLFQQDMKGGIGLVMGSEGKGMRQLTREHCDYLVSIPMAGQVESLNVSVATGVCLYEIVRQRNL